MCSRTARMFMSDCSWEVGSTLVSQSVLFGSVGFLIDQGTTADSYLAFDLEEGRRAAIFWIDISF